MSLPPFRTLRAAGRAPLVLTCEHASNRLPAGAPRDRVSRALLATHWGHDIGGWEVARRVSAALGACAVGGRWTRLWIDLNRLGDDPTLIARSVAGIELPWNRGLTATGIRRRLREVHAPYHAQIDRLILRCLAAGSRPLVMAVHTFTPVLGRARRRFDAGILYTEAGREARRLAAGLREEGLSVRYNEPYSGPGGLMYSAERHGAPHGLPGLEIEINQARLFTLRGIDRMAGAVARALARVLPA